MKPLIANTSIGYALVNPATNGVACRGDAAIIFGTHDEAAIHQINYRVPPSYEVQEAKFWHLVNVLLTGARYALNSTAIVAWNKALVENKEMLAEMPKIKLPIFQTSTPNSIVIVGLNVPRMSPSEAKAFFNRIETFGSEQSLNE